MPREVPKCESEESNRMWASMSFVGVLIVIGLPLWWKTTEVYRVSLPYEKIGAFDELPHSISTELKVLANDEATATEIARTIENAFQDEDIIKLKITKAVLSEKLQHTLASVTDEHEATEELALDLKAYNTFHVVQRPLLQDVWLAGERVAFFKDGKAAATLVNVLKQWVYQTAVLSGARAESADSARRTRVPPGAGYHVVLSVVHARPAALRVRFDARNAVEDYIGTFVDELEILHNFTLKSQWIHMLDFDFQAKEVKDSSEWGRHFAARADRLHLLLTSLEDRAATHVSELPTINLALYAVPCQKAPIVIYDNFDKPVESPVQAFMSPKWGGVVVGSPSASECALEQPMYEPDVKLVMGTFLTQLRRLLGIADTEQIKDAYLQPLRSVVPRRWEIDNLLRLRTIEQITSAETTLQSLAQLLGEISNIVINDEVGASINSAVDAIARACHLLEAGQLVEAYSVARDAHSAAETAFMDPTLLALLYFPDDQKYAIYIPLFLPIMFPVVLSLRNLGRWLRGRPVHTDKEKTD